MLAVAVNNDSDFTPGKEIKIEETFCWHSSREFRIKIISVRVVQVY